MYGYRSSLSGGKAAGALNLKFASSSSKDKNQWNTPLLPVHVFTAWTGATLPLLIFYSKNRNSQNSSLCGFLHPQFKSFPTSKCRHGHIVIKNSWIYILTSQLKTKVIFFYVNDITKKLLEVNQDLMHTLC